jgi:NAD(P)-dependent dehydrogenase (short-subunit alcohol dehydrogenase family)
MAGKLDGKLALITGASRGLGAAVAKRFAAEGAHVILTARTVGGLEEVDDEITKLGGTATLAPLDLMEADKLEMMAASIHQRFGKLDVLVSCAGYLGALMPVGHVDAKTWDKTLGINLTANLRLIRAYDPLLRGSEAGRALFATCEAARDPKAFWGPYAASKAGLEALVASYAREVAKTPIKAMTIDPGPMATRLRRDAYPGEDQTTLPSPEDSVVTNRFVEAAG